LTDLVSPRRRTGGKPLSPICTVRHVSAISAKAQKRFFATRANNPGPSRKIDSSDESFHCFSQKPPNPLTRVIDGSVTDAIQPGSGLTECDQSIAFPPTNLDAHDFGSYASISRRPASIMPSTLFFKAFRNRAVKTLSRSWLS
jgi:hypothetical protein